jgi:hypothetical protein
MPLRAEPRREPERPARPPEPELAPSIHDGRSEITVDIDAAQAQEEPKRPSRATPAWSFADVRRGRNPPPAEEAIPEPPPFGSGPHPLAAPVAAPEQSTVRPRASDEPVRRRDRALPVDPPRDRYGWSAQAEGTPVRLGWSVQAEGEPERQRWSSPAEEDAGREPEEPRINRWGSMEESSGRWSRPRDVAEERVPKRKAWDLSPDHRRDPHENDFDRRRRETAASPSAENLPLAPAPAPELDVWSTYEQAKRSRLRPEEQTEPDAPVARHGRGRADLSGAAVASEDAEDPVQRPDTRATSRAEPVDEDVLGGTEGRATGRSLNVARRPERPRPPEPRERGAVLLRGRAPVRPAPPAPPRQPDAPSLRRALRPSRVREETQTSEYLAVDTSSDDPERS